MRRHSLDGERLQAVVVSAGLKQGLGGSEGLTSPRNLLIIDLIDLVPKNIPPNVPPTELSSTPVGGDRSANCGSASVVACLL